MGKVDDNSDGSANPTDADASKTEADRDASEEFHIDAPDETGDASPHIAVDGPDETGDTSAELAVDALGETVNVSPEIAVDAPDATGDAWEGTAADTAASALGRFSEDYQANPWFCLTGQDCRVGDLDNDGFDDLIAFTRTGPVLVAYGTGTSFLGNYLRSPYFCVKSETCQVADIDNDHKLDLISFTKSGPVWVAYGTGRGNFDGDYKRANYFCVNDEDCYVADVNNDGKADLVSFTKTGPVFVAYATENRGNFSVGLKLADNFCVGDQECRVGDLNNDGRVDIIAFAKNGEVWVSYATDSGFNGDYKGEVTNTNYRILSDFCIAGEVCDVGDVNGDGWADLVVFVKSAVASKQDDVWVSRALPDGTFATPEKWSDSFCPGAQVCALGRVDSNKSKDLIAFTGTGPIWAAYAQP